MTKNTILLIDDDDDFLCALTQRCESIGLEVEQTRNLLTATLKTAKHVPDIICVDVQMPTGNGLSYCEALAADPHSSQVAIVVLTGNTDLETRQACKRLRAHYVEKTVDYWSQLGPLLRRLATNTLTDSQAPRSDTLPQESSSGLVGLVSRTELPRHASRQNTKHILVADDDEDMVRLLTKRCASMGCSVIGVNNAFDAIHEIRRLEPDLVCLDVNMPGGDGLSVCEMMAGDQRLRKIPVIILTGRSDESTIRRCHDLLVYYVEKSAHTWERVEPLVRELLNLDDSTNLANLVLPGAAVAIATDSTTRDAHDHENLADAVFAVLGAGSNEEWEAQSSDEIPPVSSGRENIPWVLCIDDDADFANVLKIRLEDHGVAVIRAHTGMEGYRLAFTTPASAILLDFNMPDGQGDYILGRLKDNPVTRDIPVVVITGSRDKMLERRMLAMGATAFFVKPVSFDQLREHLSKYIDILGLTKEELVTNKLETKSRRIMHHISEPH
jgi:CheY-like chemotaxis protein